MKERQAALGGLLARCRLHAEVIEMCLANLQPDLPLSPETLKRHRLNPGRMALWDQLAYRYMKLQDTLGQKVLPLVLEVAREPVPPETPFMQKLVALERLGVISSSEQWDSLRETRNAVAHDYPEADEVLVAEMNRLVDSARRILGELHSVERWCAPLLSSPA